MAGGQLVLGGIVQCDYGIVQVRYMAIVDDNLIQNFPSPHRCWAAGKVCSYTARACWRRLQTCVERRFTNASERQQRCNCQSKFDIHTSEIFV